MHTIYRIRIRPLGPWRTPWQADTLTGLLCWMCVRTEGETVLRKEILEPMLAGEPPFVLSDAFPGDLLPIPAATRLADWPVELRKSVKRAAWLRPDAFVRACNGEPLDASDLVIDSPIAEYDHTRNTLSRMNDTTGMEGALFTLQEYRLNYSAGISGWGDGLSIYVRVRPRARELLLYLFDELACVGFGADVGIGKGAFGFPNGVPELEPVDLFQSDRRSGDKTLIVLSTFQPGPEDPTRGVWESFVKFGKLGPGLSGRGVEKRPLVLLRPGACFIAPSEARPYLGRAIPMEEILPAEITDDLRSQGVEVVHPAFGLTITANLRLQ